MWFPLVEYLTIFPEQQQSLVHNNCIHFWYENSLACVAEFSIIYRVGQCQPDVSLQLLVPAKLHRLGPCLILPDNDR